MARHCADSVHDNATDLFQAAGRNLRCLFAVHPALLAPVLQIIHRAINTFLIKQTDVERNEAATGAITLIQAE